MASWNSPSYDFTSPSLLSRTTLDQGDNTVLLDNFPRTAKWCGDGSSLMVQCENRSFQVFLACVFVSAVGVGPTTQRQRRTRCKFKQVSLDPTPLFSWFVIASSASLIFAKTFQQPSPIVDFAWYPGASKHNLPAYCFVASVRDCPVKLLDASDGRLRASYPIVDHRERHIAPHSLAFNLTTDKLYCGFENAIEVFDVQRPGEGERLSTTPSKKSKDGLKGIISALAFSYSPEYYAAGSFTPATLASDNIALFNESASEPVLSVGGVAEWEKGGVTQLMFNPTRPHILYAAFRRSERLWSWDLRGDASVPLTCFSGGVESNGPSRENLTNQKLRFDIEGTGKWLAIGSQFGEIVIYDLEIASDEPGAGAETRQIGPALLYDAHDDAVGAVSFHPLEAILLSVSGSRHFGDVDLITSGSEDSESEYGSSDESTENAVVRRLRHRPRPSVRDTSIKMWSCSGIRYCTS